MSIFREAGRLSLDNGKSWLHWSEITENMLTPKIFPSIYLAMDEYIREEVRWCIIPCSNLHLVLHYLDTGNDICVG